MAGLKLDIFSGMRPRIPPTLLQPGMATQADNCDFAYGELRSTKGGHLVNTMSNSPKSIYTDDGLVFYTWPVDVDAVRSPIAKDLYNRLYYTGDGGFKVTNRMSAQVNGGVPGSFYLVGVPRPTVAPVLAAQIPIISAVTANRVFTFHYEDTGIKYQETTIVPTFLSNTSFRFTPPAMAAATPEAAKPVLRMRATAIADGSELFDLYTENSSFTSAGAIYSLSMSKDAAPASTYSVTLTIGVKESDKETRAYVYTYVNTYDEEGPPSAPALVDTSPVVGVTVTVQKDAIGNHAPIKEIRVYRTPSGSAIADYFYVGSISALAAAPGSTLVFTDNVTGGGLNEPLSSTNYYPPDQALVGLMSLPNGILCAWKGNELHFSEPYKPWAWPPQYIKPLAHTIVGGIANGAGAVITTVAYPYVVSGVSSDAMTATRVNVDQAGVSKWSIAVVDGTVVYATNDGFVVFHGATASLERSHLFFTREVWRARYAAGLSSMRFSVWDGRLIVFSGTGAFTPFMIRLDEADGALTDLPTFAAASAFVSILSDQCYYSLGNGIYQFNGGDNLPCTWQSREEITVRPVNFGIFQAVATGAWTLSVFADGVLRHTAAITEGKHTYRLPSGFEADRWQFRVTGIGAFKELRVATTGRELALL
ncbi:MAG: hypothetical protein WC997_02460 [Porticoccaceae bacterium]